MSYSAPTQRLSSKKWALTFFDNRSSELCSSIVKSREEHLRQLNVWSPFMLALVLFVAGAYGVGVAIPALYDSYAWRRGMQMLACFSFAELLSHWYLTRFTDASYTGHGDSVEVKVIEPQNGNSNFYPQYDKVNNQQEGFQRQSFDTCSHWVDETELTSGTSQLYEKTNDADPTFQNSELIMNNYNVNIEENSGESRKCSFGNFNGRRTSSAVPSAQLNVLDLERSTKESDQHQMWAWSHCLRCGYATPPRSHHCLVCQKCILKRQHHCFLTGVCIGAANQRHFLAFLLWAMFVTLFGTAHMILYAFGPLINSGKVSYWDLAPVVVLYHAILGYTDPLLFPLCVTFWIVLALTVAALVFLCRSLTLILLGVTEAEYAKNVKIVDQRRLSERLRHVLGENWLLNFIVPFRRRTTLQEDAVNWPYIKR